MSKQTFPRRFSWKIQSKFQNLSFTIIQNMPCFAFPLSQHRFYVLVSLYWCHRRYIPPSFAFIPGSDQLVLRCARLHTCAWAHAVFCTRPRIEHVFDPSVRRCVLAPCVYWWARSFIFIIASYIIYESLYKGYRTANSDRHSLIV